MKKYTDKELDEMRKQIEEDPDWDKDWEGPHETRVVSFRCIDDDPDRQNEDFSSPKTSEKTSAFYEIMEILYDLRDRVEKLEKKVFY